MSENPLIPYDRFFKLYTFRYLEAHTTSGLLLQVSIAALRYGAAALRTGGEAARPLEGETVDPGPDPAARVRSTVYPRWRALLDEVDPFAPLGLRWDENLHLRAGWPELERYRERRALDTSLAGYLRSYAEAPSTRLPVLASEPKLPVGAGRLELRLAQAQRFLEVLDTLLRMIGTVAGLIGEWRERRKRRALLDVQRQLLQAALSENLAGADEALRLAQEPGFVAGYLSEHAGDENAEVVDGHQSL